MLPSKILVALWLAGLSPLYAAEITRNSGSVADASYEKSSQIVSQQVLNEIDSEVESLIVTTLKYDTAIYSQARALLGSLRVSPSCNRLATVGLLRSCEDFNEQNSVSLKQKQPRLDHVKSTYAARIAVCELLEAAADVPSTCLPLMSQGAHYNSPESRYPSSSEFITDRDAQADIYEIDTAQLEICLQSLEGRPQWWTSYSNGRQNAIILCEAVRGEAEKGKVSSSYVSAKLKAKDQLLETYQRANEITSSLHSVLAEDLERFRHESSLQEGFFEKLKYSQQTLFTNMQEASEQSQALMSKTANSMENFFSALAGNIGRTNTALEQHAETLTHNIQGSSDQLEKLDQGAARILRTVLDGSAELAAKQTLDWKTTHNFATDLQISLETIKSYYVEGLVSSLAVIRSDLSVTGGLAENIQQRQTYMEERIKQLDEAFTKIEQRANDFQSVQQDQEEVQLRLLESLQTDLSTARGVLVEMATSAALLHSTVTETSDKLQRIDFFGVSRRSFTCWASLLIALVGISLLNRTIVGWMILLLG